MSGPFATYFGNQRTVAIPITPQTASASINTATTTQALIYFGLTAGNIIQTYIYWADFNAVPTAAASAMEIILQWQFQTGGGVNVGAAIPVYVGDIGASGATCIISNCHFEPSQPLRTPFTVPATATQILLQYVTFGFIGAPTLRAMVCADVDTTNSGNPGGIGGTGVTAQSATNPNAF